MGKGGKGVRCAVSGRHARILFPSNVSIPSRLHASSYVNVEEKKVGVFVVLKALADKVAAANAAEEDADDRGWHKDDDR